MKIEETSLWKSSAGTIWVQLDGDQWIILTSKWEQVDITIELELKSTFTWGDDCCTWEEKGW